MPCRVPKRRFSCGAPQHFDKEPFLMHLFLGFLESHHGHRALQTLRQEDWKQRC